MSNDGRPVLYRASIPEMVVPYGDPKFRYWQAYFGPGFPRTRAYAHAWYDAW